MALMFSSNVHEAVTGKGHRDQGRDDEMMLALPRDEWIGPIEPCKCSMLIRWLQTVSSVFLALGSVHRCTCRALYA